MGLVLMTLGFIFVGIVLDHIDELAARARARRIKEEMKWFT